MKHSMLVSGECYQLSKLCVLNNISEFNQDGCSLKPDNCRLYSPHLLFQGYTPQCLPFILVITGFEEEATEALMQVNAERVLHKLQDVILELNNQHNPITVFQEFLKDLKQLGDKSIWQEVSIAMVHRSENELRCVGIASDQVEFILRHDTGSETRLSERLSSAPSSGFPAPMPFDMGMSTNDVLACNTMDIKAQLKLPDDQLQPRLEQIFKQKSSESPRDRHGLFALTAPPEPKRTHSSCCILS